MGGAIGDALGYPVEFVGTYKAIQSRYGEQGITRYELKPYWLNESEWTGKAIVSDDTQMTLFTACGLLNAPKRGITFVDSIQRAYLEWLTTQEDNFVLGSGPKCWITTIPELNHRRAPGNTCISSLKQLARKQQPSNRSKGCGGVMRIAPIPLYAAAANRMTIEECDQLAGDAAAITHHHPLGIIPAALMAHVIYRLLQDEAPSRTSFESYVQEGMDAMRQLYSQHPRDLDTMARLVDLALTLSVNDQPDINNIVTIGQGWVAEETLAIALYCTHRYIDDFEKAITASVNHGGDSDSTGAVTGNIIGTITGYEAIPQFYKDDIELLDVILHVADELQ